LVDRLYEYISEECEVERVCYFFFQAEDGIRDRNVTGVQTCALPICCAWRWDCWPSAPGAMRRTPAAGRRSDPSRSATRRGTWPRSEERRVGKECTAGWAPGRERGKREEKDGVGENKGIRVGQQ